MKLALNLGYWAGDSESNSANIELALEAERLGYESVWAAEAYGSDAATVLSWIGARTSTIGLGSAIFQIPGRSPALTAMTAATLDALSGGRFRLGLGVSGPQVSEGWHGVRFASPLARTREYVEIVKLALGRQVVKYAGEHFTLPLPEGPGRALRLTVHPQRESIPILIAAVGPKNLELAGEIADGWLAVFLTPDFASEQLDHISTGRAKVGKTLEGFEVMATLPISPGPDVATCADLVRPYAALYVGGMGSKELNFYNALAIRMGYEAAAEEVQRKYLARDYEGAMSALPEEFLDRTSLLGTTARIAERMKEYADAGVTTLALALPDSVPLALRLDALHIGAAAYEKSGVSK
jgi:F420-dependent oxidoreductase-like protein